jgi:hypothetical protein
MSLFFWVFRTSHKASINGGLRVLFFFGGTFFVKSETFMSLGIANESKAIVIT